MARQADAIDRAADELYALAPADFTNARDELAKQLRDDGKREAARRARWHPPRQVAL